MSRMDQYMHLAEAKIDEFGWMIQGVLPTAADPVGPSFFYTVGLSKWKHPEVIVFSLPQQTAQTILNGIGARVRDGERFTDGQELTDVGNVPMRLVGVVDVREHLTLARRLFHGVRGLQLVWPDAQGLFPWEDGYSIDSRAQPLLGVWA